MYYFQLLLQNIILMDVCYGTDRKSGITDLQTYATVTMHMLAFHDKFANYCISF